MSATTFSHPFSSNATTGASKENASKVRIELSVDLLRKLITSGQLHCDQCRCLDSHAKQVVWQSLLQSSIKAV